MRRLKLTKSLPTRKITASRSYCALKLQGAKASSEGIKPEIAKALAPFPRWPTRLRSARRDAWFPRAAHSLFRPAHQKCHALHDLREAARKDCRADCVEPPHPFAALHSRYEPDNGRAGQGRICFRGSPVGSSRRRKLRGDDGARPRRLPAPRLQADRWEGRAGDDWAAAFGTY